MNRMNPNEFLLFALCCCCWSNDKWKQLKCSCRFYCSEYGPWRIIINSRSFMNQSFYGKSIKVRKKNLLFWVLRVAACTKHQCAVTTIGIVNVVRVPVFFFFVFCVEWHSVRWKSNQKSHIQDFFYSYWEVHMKY